MSGDALNNGHTVTPLAAAGAPTFVKVSAEQVAFQPDSTTSSMRQLPVQH